MLELKEKEETYPVLLDLKENVHSQRELAFKQGEDGVLKYQDKLCVPKVDRHQERIMEEAHSSRNSIYSGYTRMYHDLREVYWLECVKNNIAEFVSKCSNYQKVKVDHQGPGDLTQNLELQE